jgi:hypothetical protein
MLRLSRRGDLTSSIPQVAIWRGAFLRRREVLQRRREVHANLRIENFFKFVGHKTIFPDKKIEKIGAIEMHDL